MVYFSRKNLSGRHVNNSSPDAGVNVSTIHSNLLLTKPMICS